MVLEIWFEKSGLRNLVRGRCFCKLGFFFLVREKWLTRKKIRVCRTTFLEPLFYIFLEKWLQIKWSFGSPTPMKVKCWFFFLSWFCPCLSFRFKMRLLLCTSTIMTDRNIVNYLSMHFFDRILYIISFFLMESNQKNLVTTKSSNYVQKISRTSLCQKEITS